MAEDELVPVGRVGRPHGLDGSFVVEGGSDDPRRFEPGTEVLVGGAPARILARRHARGRPVLRLDRRVERGETLAVPRSALPEPEEGRYYVFQLVGLEVLEEGGRRLGTVTDVLPLPANDVLELDSGLSLPLVDECVRTVDLDRRVIEIALGFAGAE